MAAPTNSAALPSKSYAPGPTLYQTLHAGLSPGSRPHSSPTPPSAPAETTDPADHAAAPASVRPRVLSHGLTQIGKVHREEICTRRAFKNFANPFAQRKHRTTAVLIWWFLLIPF